MDNDRITDQHGRVDVDDDRPIERFEVTGEAPVLEPETDPQPSFWDLGTSEPATRHGVGRMALAWFIAAALGAGVGGALTYVAVEDGGSGVDVNVVGPPVRDIAALDENAAARVAAEVLPSIVQIDVNGDFTAGLGSGVIYSDDGYILTNDHVIQGASEILVNLPDGRQLPASVVGSAANVNVDIAVLKVAAEGLPAATFGSSEDLVVGELAVALGSPFGLDSTVTAGIISALHRNITPAPNIRFTNAIQTDAPINPGNSGGALADSRGAVIGINTAILGDSGNVGVGFAIPIDIARKVADQIIAGGRAQLPFLGIEGDNLPGRGGARVRAVDPGSAADAAGIREGDVIVELDGEAVDSMDSLIALLIERDVGQEVGLVVERGGDRITLTATLQARPEG